MRLYRRWRHASDEVDAADEIGERVRRAIPCCMLAMEMAKTPARTTAAVYGKLIIGLSMADRSREFKLRDCVMSVLDDVERLAGGAPSA